MLVVTIAGRCTSTGGRTAIAGTFGHRHSAIHKARMDPAEVSKGPRLVEGMTEGVIRSQE